MGGSKALTAGPAVKQVVTLVLAILAANRNVALTTQAVILAFFVGAETVLMLVH
jgi:hypothetical protein